MRIAGYLLGFLTWGLIFWVSYGRGVIPLIRSLRSQSASLAMGRMFILCFLLLEVIIQGLWVAYCSDRAMNFVQDLGKPLAYGLGFLCCQVPLAMVARSETPGSLYHVARSVIPMGLFPAFVLNPRWLLMYQWILSGFYR